MILLVQLLMSVRIDSVESEIHKINACFAKTAGFTILNLVESPN